MTGSGYFPAALEAFDDLAAPDVLELNRSHKA
jgi:hypothetical protein